MEEHGREQRDHDWKRVQEQCVDGGRDEMQCVEIAAGLPNVARAAHDRQAEEAAAWRQALPRHGGRQPEQQSRQPEAITQELRRAQSETVGELAEDAEAAEETGRGDNKCHSSRTAIADRRAHAVILGTRPNYWTSTGT